MPASNRELEKRFKEYKRGEGNTFIGILLVDNYVERHIIPPGIYDSEKYDRMVIEGKMYRDGFKVMCLMKKWSYDEMTKEAERLRERFEDSITIKQFKEFESKKETGWSYEDDWCYHSFHINSNLGGKVCRFCGIVSEEIFFKPGFNKKFFYSFTYLKK